MFASSKNYLVALVLTALSATPLAADNGIYNKSVSNLNSLLYLKWPGLMRQAFELRDQKCVIRILHFDLKTDDYPVVQEVHLGALNLEALTVGSMMFNGVERTMLYVRTLGGKKAIMKWSYITTTYHSRLAIIMEGESSYVEVATYLQRAIYHCNQIYEP